MGKKIISEGITKVGKNVFIIEMLVEENQNRDKTFLFTSDRHRDNPKSDRKLQEYHLKQAREKNAKVLDFGDFFCAMQGKGDPRGSKDAIRPEHNVGNYLDALVDTATDRLEPYADQFYLITKGNHETSVEKHHETDLIQRLVACTNKAYKTNIQAGPYAGRVVFQFRDKLGMARGRKILSYTHGYGGGGPVTKGVIQANRKSVYLPEADILVQGHIHEFRYFPQVRERLTQQLRPYLDMQTHLCCGTYKEEYLGGEGFHIERGRPPKPMKMRWVKFYYNLLINDFDVKFEATD